jgi:hypothetical protein
MSSQTVEKKWEVRPTIHSQVEYITQQLEKIEDSNPDKYDQTYCQAERELLTRIKANLLVILKHKKKIVINVCDFHTKDSL